MSWVLSILSKRINGINGVRLNLDIHRRRSIRLRGYDYSQAGAYFLTICLQHRECLFIGQGYSV
ncbi:MAG: hypothetical protein D3916_08935 [Candidatus Electrothrix sp. MAN1_4]|nr:hypothetical protein [Candidatus Electrothrix sp. MAN1_4]